MTYLHHATVKQMESLDKLAVESGLEIIQMMELAGFQMVKLFQLLKISKATRIVIVCGKGNNGGDGLSAARFLFNSGWKVNVVLAETALINNAKHHLKLLRKMKIPILYFSKDRLKSSKLIDKANIIIDALLGYHIQGNPKKPYAEIINLVNNSSAKVIAYDLPSGLDGSSGNCFFPCVRADYTLALALPKKAFQTQNGNRQSGQVYVADIGIPAFLYNKIQKHSRPDFMQTLNKL